MKCGIGQSGQNCQIKPQNWQKKVLFQLGGESVAPTCRYGTLYGHYCLLLLRFFVSSLLGHFCSDFEKYHSASWLLRFLVYLLQKFELCFFATHTWYLSFFYTHIFWGLEILHSKVRKFATTIASRQNRVVHHSVQNYTHSVKLHI